MTLQGMTPAASFRHVVTITQVSTSVPLVQGLGDASVEGEVSGVPPQDSDPNAGFHGVDSLGTVAQLPAAPTGPPPPVPPPAPPYLAGLGSYGDVTAADVGAYPVRLCRVLSVSVPSGRSS